MKIRTYLTMLITFATLTLVSSLVANAQSESLSGHKCERQALGALSTNIGGKSILCSTRSGLHARITATHMQAKDAYTVWWVYFDDPSSCEIPGQCSLVDFEGIDPLGVFGRMDSLVVGRSGRGHFNGSLKGFKPAEGSQVWLLIFGHGIADDYDAKHRARQLLTPEDPNAGAPHLGNSVDGSLGFPAALTVFQF